jgi:hypothetical protein
VSAQDDHYLVVEEQRRLDQSSNEQFDRIAFAMRALRVLRPRLTVAVYPRARELHVERGRDLSGGPDASFAMLGVPPDASREHIALAIAELGDDRQSPLLVELLLGTTARRPD